MVVIEGRWGVRGHNVAGCEGGGGIGVVAFSGS